MRLITTTTDFLFWYFWSIFFFAQIENLIGRIYILLEKEEYMYIAAL